MAVRAGRRLRSDAMSSGRCVRSNIIESLMREGGGAWSRGRYIVERLPRVRRARDTVSNDAFALSGVVCEARRHVGVHAAAAAPRRL